MKKTKVYGDPTTLDIDVFEAAKQRISDCFDQADTVVVCFSGGKDSTAVLNIALEVAEAKGKLPLRVYHMDEECAHRETVEYVERVAKDPRVDLTWSCVPVKHRNACSKQVPHYLTFDPAIPEKWVRQPPACAITAGDRPDIPWGTIADQIGYFYPPSLGTVIQIVGRRTQESLTRHRMVANRGPNESYLSRGSMSEWKHIRTADPIYDWTTEDVWLAPQMHGWDYNRLYDKYFALGIPLASQRVAPPFGEEPAATLWTWRLIEPELWDKMVGRLPGVATAGRLYKTKLYRRRTEDFEPAEGESWPDYVQSLVMQWEPESRAIVASNIQRMIRHHRTTIKRAAGKITPIPDVVADPYTGVSWAVLAKVAHRGMLKSRTLTSLMGASDAGRKSAT